MNILLVSNSFIICEALENIFKSVLNVDKVNTLPRLEEALEDDFKNVDLTFIDLSSTNTELKIIEKIKTMYQDTKIMILDLAKNKEVFKKAISLGVEGYMLDINDRDEFIYYIKGILKGKKLYSSDLVKDLLKEDEIKGITELTFREEEVMRLVAKGYKNKDIAKALYVTEYTIKKHVSSILNKLDFRNRRDIIIYMKEVEGKI